LFIAKEGAVMSARPEPIWKFFARVVFYASLTRLLEMASWAVLFMICGEFSDFGTAFYHSAVNYTSLGYGDRIMDAFLEIVGSP
jgi:hypothetical protein